MKTFPVSAQSAQELIELVCKGVVGVNTFWQWVCVEGYPQPLLVQCDSDKGRTPLWHLQHTELVYKQQAGLVLDPRQFEAAYKLALEFEHAWALSHNQGLEGNTVAGIAAATLAGKYILPDKLGIVAPNLYFDRREGTKLALWHSTPTRSLSWRVYADGHVICTVADPDSARLVLTISAMPGVFYHLQTEGELHQERGAHEFWFKECLVIKVHHDNMQSADYALGRQMFRCVKALRGPQTAQTAWAQYRELIKVYREGNLQAPPSIDESVERDRRSREVNQW